MISDLFTMSIGITYIKYSIAYLPTLWAKIAVKKWNYLFSIKYKTDGLIYASSWFIYSKFGNLVVHVDSKWSIIYPTSRQ